MRSFSSHIYHTNFFELSPISVHVGCRVMDDNTAKKEIPTTRVWVDKRKLVRTPYIEFKKIFLFESK